MPPAGRRIEIRPAVGGVEVSFRVRAISE